MKLSIFARTSAALALAFSILCAHSARTATPPQYILDPTLNAPLFTARAVALRSFVMPDDRFFVAGGSGDGAFQRVDGQPSGNLYRCNADGTRDNTFALDPQLRDFTVSTIALAPGNKVYAACVPPPFVGGPERVFRLNSDGSLDPTFNAGAGTAPNAGGVRRISSVLVDQFERVIVGGQFGDFSSSGHPNLVRLTSTGAADPGFASVNLQAANNASPSISPASHMGMALQADAKLIITGLFDSVNGVARAQVARLNSDGSLDTEFVPSGYVTSNNLIARCLAIQPDGNVLVGGSLRATSPANTQARVLMRFDSSGARDTSFSTETIGSTVRALKILADGSIVIALTSPRPLRRIASNGATDATFFNNTPTYPNGGAAALYTVDTQSDGKIIFSGGFQFANGKEYHGYARLNQDGTLEPTLHHSIALERETLPSKIAARSDGKIMVTGDFDRVNGVARVGAALLNQDGSLSGVTFPSFVVYVLPGPPGFFLPPSFLLLPNDQALFFGLVETGSGGTTACQRINPDGSDDQSFSFAYLPRFGSALSHGSGFLLSAGFSAQSVVEQILLRRLLENGSVDEAVLFGVALVERNPDGTLRRMYVGDNRALATLPGDKILFKFFDGANYQLLRLGADGFPDDSFTDGTAAPRGTFLAFPTVFDPYDPRGGLTLQPPDGAVEPTSLGPMCVLRLNDGRLILGGEFVSYNGMTAGGLAQLTADGALISTLGNGVSFSAAPTNTQREPSVTALEFESTGRILALGDFDRYNGAAAPGLVRIDADGNHDLSFAPPLVPRSSGNTFTETPLLAREPGGSFLVVGNYSATRGASAATSIFRLLPVPIAGSRKTHGASSTFDVDLPFSGAAGVEPRVAEAGGNHKIVVKFPAAVTFTGASVTSGTGSVFGASGNGSDELVIDVTGVANAQTINVTIAGVNDGSAAKDIIVRMSTLVGDSNADRSVNAGDTTQTRNRSGQPLGATNFRSDFNKDGDVNSGDTTIVRGRSGNSL